MESKLDVVLENSDGFTVYITSCEKITREHDVRCEEAVKLTEHIDKSRSDRNKILIDKGDPNKYFTEYFADPWKNYVLKHPKYKNMTYLDYLSKDKRRGSKGDTNSDTSRKALYQLCIYIGNCDYRCPDDISKRILEVFIMKILPMKYKNIIITNAAIHNDEFAIDQKGNRIESEVHAHVIGFYVADALTPEEVAVEQLYKQRTLTHAKFLAEYNNENWNANIWKQHNHFAIKQSTYNRWGKILENGMEKQCSINAACMQMGFIPDQKDYDENMITPPMLLWASFRKDLRRVSEILGVRTNSIKNEKRANYPKKLYKALKQADLVILSYREKEAELKRELMVMEIKKDILVKQLSLQKEEALVLEKKKENLRNRGSIIYKQYDNVLEARIRNENCRNHIDDTMEEYSSVVAKYNNISVFNNATSTINIKDICNQILSKKTMSGLINIVTNLVYSIGATYKNAYEQTINNMSSVLYGREESGHNFLGVYNIYQAFMHLSSNDLITLSKEMDKHGYCQLADLFKENDKFFQSMFKDDISYMHFALILPPFEDFFNNKIQDIDNYSTFNDFKYTGENNSLFYKSQFNFNNQWEEWEEEEKQQISKVKHTSEEHHTSRGRGR